MESSLESLPVELVGEIIEQLDRGDILSLRLTNRTLNYKIPLFHLRKFFLAKDVKLARRPLENMVYVTSNGRLGALLEELTILGGTENEDEDGTNSAPESSDLVRLLTEAFINLRSHSPKGGLSTLQLSTIKGYSEKDFQGTVSRPTFNITMKALRETQLPIYQTLGLFMRCGLQRDAFFSLPQMFASTYVFSSLKQLMVQVKLSPKQISEQPGFANNPPSASDEQHLNSNNTIMDADRDLALFLFELSEIMPALEDIHLEGDTEEFDLSPTVASPPIHDGESGHSPFPKLKSCSLIDIPVSGDDLLHFVRTARPKELQLAGTELTSGHYSPLFEYLSLPDTITKKWYFEVLKEGSMTVSFDARPRADLTDWSAEPVWAVEAILNSFEVEGKVTYTLY
ncbi:hypothetical protein F4777DRAFT_601560 [Nemania sp. FL0916]|nr:hypothetical protein F4777DRAFT_601560 [Nemania sp. FL0916]